MSFHMSSYPQTCLFCSSLNLSVLSVFTSVCFVCLYICLFCLSLHLSVLSVFTSVCLPTYLCVYLPLHLFISSFPVCLSIHLFKLLSVCPSILFFSVFLSIYSLYTYTLNGMFVCLSICLFADSLACSFSFPSVCLSVFLSFHLSVCPSSVGFLCLFILQLNLRPIIPSIYLPYICLSFHLSPYPLT